MTAVLVIGMHRSGTSLVTNMLHAAGVYIGDSEGVIPADQWNSAGYWEHGGFHDLNERLLAHLSGSWYEPPVLPNGWLNDVSIQPFLSEGRELIESDFAQHPLWTIKDPRTSLLLPFWQRIVENERYVICVRNPADVAGSLEKRDGIPAAFAAALWYVYTLRSLLYTIDKEVLIVHYEDILKDPQGACAGVMKFLEIEDAGASVSAAGVVERGLKHNEHTLAELLDDERFPSAAKRLYSAIVEKDKGEIEKMVSAPFRISDDPYYIIEPCARLFTLLTEARQKEEDTRQQLDIVDAALRNLRDIMNSRAHRVASTANRWLLKVRGMS